MKYDLNNHPFVLRCSHSQLLLREEGHISQLIFVLLGDSYFCRNSISVFAVVFETGIISDSFCYTCKFEKCLQCNRITKIIEFMESYF